ncbi:MAG: thioredoxin domain-containing protein [Planctomycetota bacterium]
MARMLMGAVMAGVWMCAGASARAEDKPANVEELKKGQEELRAELASVKTELAAVRGDLQKILAQLTEMRKTAQQPPAQKPQPQQPLPDTTVYDVQVGSSPVRGPKDAKVTIVEFADFQCPFCIREWPKLQQVLNDYPKDVKLVFKHYPLPFHKQAKPAHAATALAAKKGNDAFWKMHDDIIANPKNLAVEDLRKYAESQGLDLAEFDKVMADEAQQDALLETDKGEAGKCKVSGTPSIFINGLKLSGGRAPEDYKARIDAILKGEDKASAPKAIELKPAGEKP